MLNIDEDHLDYFRDLDHIEQTLLPNTSALVPRGRLVHRHGATTRARAASAKTPAAGR